MVLVKVINDAPIVVAKSKDKDTVDPLYHIDAVTAIANNTHTQHGIGYDVIGVSFRVS